MAVHPLRPATDRRLGKPLPYQPANQTRTHPIPMKYLTLLPCGKKVSYGFNPGFPRLFLCTGQIVHALLTRPPLSLSLHQILNLSDIYECWQAIISVKRIFSLSFTYITSYNTTLFIIFDHFTKMRLRWFSLIFGEATNLVRLACVRHAASVRPEPGSNSRLIFSLLKLSLSC